MVKGDSSLKRPGVEGLYKIRKGDRINVADTLETGKNSRIQIFLYDRSAINISAGTAMRISQYAYDREKDRQSAVANILKGRVRFFLKEHKGGSDFRIETGQAFMNISMADFIVTVTEQQTTVCTLQGNVGVRNISNLVVGNVQVNENRCSAIMDRTPPSPPSIITSEQKREYSRDARSF